MAHNFKKTGLRYISKSGHDSNDGLTPDTPKRSLTDANIPSGVKTVIGAGHYVGGSLINDHNALVLTGDGKVILDSVSVGLNRYFYTQSPQVLNIEFRNMPIVIREAFIAEFIAKNCTVSGSVAGAGISHGILINCNLKMLASNFTVSNDMIVINTTGTLVHTNNSYYDRNCVLTYIGNYNLSIRNCNFRGIIKFDTSTGYKEFAYQDQMVGTPQDNGYSLGVQWLNEANMTAAGTITSPAGWNTAIATCINREPLFNNESIEDFTLQAGSPHIGRGINGVNIGSTEVAFSIVNTDNGTGTAQVIPSPEINTTNPNSFTVNQNETEGYIDYIQKIGTSSLVLKEIDPITALEFNSDIAGGGTGNKNVPDSEPLSFEYPRKLITTSAAADALTLNVLGHNVIAGEFIRYAGQDREVLSVTADTIALDTALRAIVPSGATFQVGEKVRIGALNPNRLTFMMRTSKEDNPQVDSDWDNDIDPVYGKAGQFLTQEWGEVPGYFIDIDNNAVWGSGDSETPPGLTKNEISCKWVHIRVYIRNNYTS